jgi:hypothetical protein
MRQILIIVLMLVGFSIQAQEMYLHKVYYESPDKEKYLRYELTYTNHQNWELDTIYWYDKESNKDVYRIYQNDTIKQDGGNGYKYIHTDSIIYKYLGTDTIKYFVNDNYEIINSEGSSVFEIVWEDGNFVELFSEDSLNPTTINTYQEDYINPFYNANRTFKSPSNLFSILDGSYNLKHQFIVFPDYLMDDWWVDLSTGSYPLKVDRYEEGSQWKESYYFEYYTVTDIPELSSEPYTVLQVNYYDLMGREIIKPSKGFYIERKSTDKGTISTKHYIP